MLMCAKVSPDFADELVARMDWRKADIEGALSVYAGALREALTAVKVGPGTNVVGTNMEPGNLPDQARIQRLLLVPHNRCGIIANDFVGFAPNGVTSPSTRAKDSNPNAAASGPKSDSTAHPTREAAGASAEPTRVAICQVVFPPGPQWELISIDQDSEHGVPLVRMRQVVP